MKIYQFFYTIHKTTPLLLTILIKISEVTEAVTSGYLERMFFQLKLYISLFNGKLSSESEIIDEDFTKLPNSLVAREIEYECFVVKVIALLISKR